MLKWLILILVGTTLGVSGVFLWPRAPLKNASAFFPLERQEIWTVRSVDTMKTSRDLARAKLHVPAFDQEITQEVQAIKSMGANYIALGTPYDAEFLPYLHRWVKIAREHDLKIWYRGTFSAYEGWFEYPKEMTPDELIVASVNFIEDNPELFEDGDIFDACPECENAGHWPQPQADSQYNAFIRRKHQALEAAFEDINTEVEVSYAAIIGGRAKDVMDQATFDTLGNVVALDHYAAAPANYSEYVRYFADTFQTEVVFSEVGAPIPDLHGRMSEQQQADFIEEVFLELYHSRPWVRGVNYWVLSQGTTALLNSDSSPREVVEVVKDYYQSAWLYGRVSNTLGLGLSEIEVQVAGMNTTQTDAFGRFGIAVPAGEYELTFSGAEYTSEQVTVTASRAADLEYSVVLEPSQKSWWYQLKERLQELKMSAQDME